jgi:mRNA-degrading endonuclease RelE of RelBE toxin-antitoxin system
MTKLVVLPAAQRYIKKIREKALKELFRKAIDDILDDPSIGAVKTGDLKGIQSLDIYYNKTNYELAYRVVKTEETVVVILLAGTRENFYQQLKKYLTSAGC